MDDLFDTRDAGERERSGYQRVYRTINFGCLGGAIAVVSVLLSRSYGLPGLLLPPVLVGAVYAVVSYALDALIFVLELRAGAREADPRRPRR